MCTCICISTQWQSVSRYIKSGVGFYFQVNHNVQHVSFIPLFRLSEPSVDWAERLTIPTPTRFSVETSEAIESGILNKKACVEVHNSVATLMLVHTSRPTSNDRDVVCRQLIQKYPTLKDGSDSGYVSPPPLPVSPFILVLEERMPLWLSKPRCHF